VAGQAQREALAAGDGVRLAEGAVDGGPLELGKAGSVSQGLVTSYISGGVAHYSRFEAGTHQLRYMYGTILNHWMYPSTKNPNYSRHHQVNARLNND
jgi:hypothetical protein